MAAIIVKEANLAQLETEVDLIRKQEFNGSEIKSNGIKGKHTRRVRVLNKVLKLPFNILTLIVDKREVFAEHGIYRNKKYFYEFINNLVYKELRGAYPSLHIVTDEVGEHEFASVFSKYVKSHRKPINLFDMEDFDIVDSKSTNGVQLADLIAGTLSYIYDDHKKKTIPTDIDYLRMLEKKLLLIKFFPKSYDEKLFEHSEGDNNYNKNIALLSYRKAEQYVTEHTMSSDEDIQRQVFTLKYLLFRFKYIAVR